MTVAQNEVTRQEEPRVIVQSEEKPDVTLLETRICKEDSFQKQQGASARSCEMRAEADVTCVDTLIVWTETTTSVDMALSFQESEGCAAIW